MFKPKFCFDNDQQDGCIVIKDEPLKDDPTDETHPTTKQNSLDPHELKGAVAKLAESNWAWKFKFKDEVTGKEMYQQFTDIQCMSIEFMY